MTHTTVTSQDFEQHAESAREASRSGPVFITDHGKAAHVLLSIEHYHDLKRRTVTLAEAVAQQDPTDFEFAPPTIAIGMTRVPDLS